MKRKVIKKLFEEIEEIRFIHLYEEENSRMKILTNTSEISDKK